MTNSKELEFANLFQQFLNSYPYTSSGLRHVAAYDERRQQIARKFEIMMSLAISREDVAKNFLIQLLECRNLIYTWQSDFKTNVNSAFIEDMKLKLATQKDSQQLAKEVLNFFRECRREPDILKLVCKNFAQSSYSKQFQAEIITPILNSVQPDKFLLIDNDVLLTINYFSGTNYTLELADYPELNIAGQQLIVKFSDILHQPGLPALRDDDIYNMFSYWLVNVKKYNLDNIPKVKKLSLYYTLAECAENISIDEEQLKRWLFSIQRKKQAILYGSPGTGKSFIAENIAKHLTSLSDGFSELIQFHPAYSYEDFIQGIRPLNQDGKLVYSLVEGRFLEFCEKAKCHTGTCVLIIDEINRANLSQVFGELMYLLEYREKEIPLAAGGMFYIPKNVYIIGTMNTADRSIALVDYALRRRFAFIELRPNYEVLRRYHEKIGIEVDGLINILQQVNQSIADKNFEIGISFFLTKSLKEELEDIWCMEIEPYLEEYFFNQPDKVDEFSWQKVKHQIQL